MKVGHILLQDPCLVFFNLFLACFPSNLKFSRVPQYILGRLCKYRDILLVSETLAAQKRGKVLSLDLLYARGIFVSP